MSAYQSALRNGLSVFRGVDFAAVRAGFWSWWIGLYAEAPRTLPPML